MTIKVFILSFLMWSGGNNENSLAEEAERNQLLIVNNDWSRCHIHHNPNHWWGSEDDFSIVEESYKKLDEFILSKWG